MRKFVIQRNPPIAWAAPRLGKNTTYDIRAKDKQKIITELQSQFNKSDLFPFSGPLRVDFFFEMPIPNSFSKKRTNEILEDWRNDFKNWHSKKPDLTNMRKLYEDCLERAGIISNDSIIACGMTEKYYSPEPRILISIYPADVRVYV
jgi:Holliday junction resolvase RusA-like endonuclease